LKVADDLYVIQNATTRSQMGRTRQHHDHRHAGVILVDSKFERVHGDIIQGEVGHRRPVRYMV
jgi:hypothetical protein